MKKLLLLAFAAFAFAACSDDDKMPTPPQRDLQRRKCFVPLVFLGFRRCLGHVVQIRDVCLS